MNGTKIIKNPVKTIFIAAFILFIAVIVFWGFNNNNFEKSLSTVSIKNNQKFNSDSITVEMTRPFYFQPFKFLIDNKDVTSSVKSEEKKLFLSLENLEEGRHMLKIYSDVNLYSMAPYSMAIYFDIDMTSPKLEITSPEERLLNTAFIEITGKSEPTCNLTFECNGDTFSTESSSTGYFSKKLTLSSGNNEIILTARDFAGNINTKKLSFEVDNMPPEIKYFLPEEDKIIDEDTVRVEAMFFDRGSGIKDIAFFLDGKRLPSILQGNGIVSTAIKSLDEGQYNVMLQAEDNAGGMTEEECSFTVDTTEVFGEKTLRPGAIGKDVRELQKNLCDLGYLKDIYINGIYDEETMKAITTYQASKKMEIDTILDRPKLLAFCNKIRVYLDEYKLYLLSPANKVIKCYPIACGSYAWPTPPGNYYIKDKEMYPTWYPPPSPWAVGAKPIPPGPGNPLGTRWIGLNGEDLGIHGTPSAWSIGYPDSHGCIRMFIPDAEELYDLVQVGTPVDIYSTRPEAYKELETNQVNNEQNEKIRWASQIIEESSKSYLLHGM